MKILLTLLLTLSLGVFAAPNSIIAIANDGIITMDSINDKINKETTKKQKIALVERQIDIMLQEEKIQALGIAPKPETINKMLEDVAAQNDLTFEQLRANDQFDKITKTITRNLSLVGLKQMVLQQAKIDITQAEIDEMLTNNPKKADVTEEIHLANIEAQIIRVKQNSFFQDWVKSLRRDAYVEIFEDKLK